jgi:hypothetical protein
MVRHNGKVSAWYCAAGTALLIAALFYGCAGEDKDKNTSPQNQLNEGVFEPAEGDGFEDDPLKADILNGDFYVKKSTIDDEFPDDIVIVTLNHTANVNLEKTYTPEDFPEIDCLFVTE